ncbi:HNH endonuclease signature motif containing protein [Nocardia stercoris]|uniref:HNH endonuclease n=1 Tax=Nocardia stercoris TaxID=2483361 RepID=A0A3M2LEI4_9NOCA|nr:HNH endonuclease signature motif containing protein [Nocardia stercoris]RMI35476.1 HNH endonuclease [Nocardia stercoris]
MSEFAARYEARLELVDRLRAAHATLAAAQADKIRLETELYHLRRSEELEFGINPAFAGESVATEIAVTLKCSQRQADHDVNLGLALQHRFPHTREAFAAGQLEPAKVQIICAELDSVADEVVATLEPRIVQHALDIDPSRLKRTIRRWVLEVDSRAQIKRRKQAERDRDVTIFARDDGTAGIDATMTAEGGRALYHRLREMATGDVCGRDPRTLGQRRSDALAALADTGRLACQCGRPDCPRSDDLPEPRRALVHVGVSAETLLGIQDNPALLQGFGAIDAHLARRIARHARFVVLPEPPETGSTPTSSTEAADHLPATAEPELRYRPSRALAQRVRAFDAVCRAPGCTVPAALTDLDHCVPFDHSDPVRGGPTTEANLACRCRRHHRLKTDIDNGYVRWRIRQGAGRREEWVTPAGASMVSEPEGVEYLFPRERVAKVQELDPAEGSVMIENDFGCAAHLFELIRLTKASRWPDVERAWSTTLWKDVTRAVPGVEIGLGVPESAPPF